MLWSHLGCYPATLHFLSIKEPVRCLCIILCFYHSYLSWLLFSFPFKCMSNEEFPFILNALNLIDFLHLWICRLNQLHKTTNSHFILPFSFQKSNYTHFISLVSPPLSCFISLWSPLSSCFISKITSAFMLCILSYSSLLMYSGEEPSSSNVPSHCRKQSPCCATQLLLDH